MPDALSIGVPYELFWRLNPTKLKPFYESHKLKIKMRDEEMWAVYGNYMISALTVAIDRCFNGRKSSAKFIEHPILSKDIALDGELTEEELQRQRELFVAKLRAMKANFDLNHKKEGADNGRSKDNA